MKYSLLLLYKVVPNFQSVDYALMCGHSNEGNCAYHVVLYAAQGGSNV